MIVNTAQRILSGTIGGGVIGFALGLGSLRNPANKIKFQRFKEYKELPFHGAKVGAVVGGTLCGLYPIVVPYMAYHIGKNYDLSREEIQIISQDMGTSHIYDVIKLNAKIVLDQINKN